MGADIMPHDEFTEAARNAEFLADLLSLTTTDFERVRRTLSFCDAVGHILDPTAYRDRMEDREALAKWLDALVPCLAAAREFNATRTRVLAARAEADPPPRRCLDCYFSTEVT